VLGTRLQELKTQIRLNANPSLEECRLLLEDIQHYVEFSESSTFNVRFRYAPFFLTIPEADRPGIRSLAWMNHPIAYLYMTYVNDHCRTAWEPTEIVKLPTVLYRHIMNLCGLRVMLLDVNGFGMKRTMTWPWRAASSSGYLRFQSNRTDYSMESFHI
jgi:hypothetical protein